MKIEEVVTQNLYKHVSLGVGRWGSAASDDSGYGKCIYQYEEDNDMVIEIYSNGFKYSSQSLELNNIFIFFNDLNVVKSYLTTDLCSDISRVGDNRRKIPMQISYLDGHDCMLRIPFLIYSAILVTLNECMSLAKGNVV